MSKIKSLLIRMSFLMFMLWDCFVFGLDGAGIANYYIQGDFINGNKIIEDISNEDLDKIKENNEQLKKENGLLNKRVEDLENQIKEIREKIPSLKMVSQELVTNKNLTKLEINKIKRRYKLATKAYFKQDYNKAIEYFSDLTSEVAIPSNYIALATSYKHVSKYNLAKENYVMAIELAKNHDDYLVIRLYALEGLADICIELGRFQDAVIMLQEALSIVDNFNDTESKASILGLLGNAYDSLAQFKDASRVYQEAVILARLTANKHSEAIQLHNIGILEFKLGNFLSAKDYFEQALVIIKAHRDKNNEELIVGSLGQVHKKLGNFSDSLKYLNQALIMARERKHLIGEGTWLNALSVVYRALGESSKAMLYAEQSLDIAREIGDRRGEAARYISLANVYGDLGDSENLIYYSNLAIQLSNQIGDKGNQFIALKNLGYWYIGLNKSELALKNLTEALAIAESIFGVNSKEVKEVHQTVYNLNKKATVPK